MRNPCHGRAATRILVAGLCVLAAGCGPRELFPHGPNGIAFDGQDRLHVASVRGDEIVVVDPETGRLLERLGPRRGIRSPDDLAFAADGSLYWTSLETGEVGRLPPRGEGRRQLVGPGVNPVAFSGDGRLFAALAYRGDALFELDPRLVAPPRLVARDLGWLNGMDFGPDGRLYAPVWSRGEVVRIDADRGSVERVASGFEKPAAVKFDAQGRLHLVEHSTGSVWRLDARTGGKELVAQLHPRLDNLAFDSRDRLFVSHSVDRAVYEVLPGGATRRIGGRD